METENELLLKQKIHSLEQEIEQLKEHLKKYTAPSRSKLFYENHKSTVLQKNKEYKDKTNYYSILTAEKKKEYARTAYLNKKEKLKNKVEENI